MSTQRSETGRAVQRHGWAVLAAVGMMAAAGWAAEGDLPAVRMTHRAMGAEFDFVLVGDSPQTSPDALTYAGEAAFEVIDRLERRISNWIGESPVSVMNRRASEGPVVVDHDVFGLLETSRRFYDDTDGVFDVTVGPLLARWGFYNQKGVLPKPEALAALRESVGMHRVELDPATRSVRFTRPGMRVDFGGIGKGLALDRAAEILRQNGVNRARLHASTSTIVVMGTPPASKTWGFEITWPFEDPEGKHPPVTEVEIAPGESLSTSSASERYVEMDGKRYAHIFDPRTGRPVDTNIRSATAVAPTGTESDALSTAFFILGEDAVRAYCAKHPAVRALLVVEREGRLDIVRINFPDRGKTEEGTP